MCGENETSAASIGIYAALFLLLEDDYEKSRLAVTREFIEVSHFMSFKHV
jgi:hypothetical protein